ncbi:YidB family protein [Geminicoccus sp.]|uniref:YidB family protein n=1 Tax=Geminicoccus sp. TaxID=2024832 RepID=UPI0032C210CB
MSRGLPSMTALLGLLAVAGYQNRDKLAEMFGGSQGTAGGATQPHPQGGGFGQSTGAAQQTGGGGLGGLLGGLGGLLGGGGGASTHPDSILSGGLGDLVDRFRQSGHGEVADSWVQSGPNKEVAPHQLEQAIGPDALATLMQHTGLSREELLSRLTRELPNAVDKYTPDGRLPA